MSRKWYKYFLFVILTAGCKKTVMVNDIIELQITNKQIIADGASIDTIYGHIPINAIATNREILFKTSTGLFQNNADTISISANLTNIQNNKITAAAILTSSLRIGLDTIIAYTYSVPQYSDSATINLTPSLPDSISLESSSFLVQPGYQSDVTITGQLFSKTGGMVSQGYKVLFNDFYKDHTPVNGSYMDPQNISNNLSQVSVVYSPGLVADSTFMYISGTVVDSMNVPLAKPDTIQLFISQ